MSKKQIIAIFLLLLMAATLFGCAKETPNATEETKLHIAITPTGEGDPIQLDSVYANETLYYLNANGYVDEVPKGYKLYGTIAATGTEPPVQELHAAYIETGCQVFTARKQPNYVYVVYPDGTVFEFASEAIVVLH